MTRRELESYERAAIEAAQKAGELIRRRFRRASRPRVELKGLHDYVTEVDREAEAAIVGSLEAAFPDLPVLAEEGSPEVNRPGMRWVVDPLDGTTNFLHGVPFVAVSVALEDPELGVLAGAVCDPIHGEIFHARKGGGAWLDGRRTHCSRVRRLEHALLATGFPFRELGRLDGYLRAFEAFVRTTAGLRRPGAASLDLAYTACGRFDGFFEIGLSRWDLAAGALLVLEAGGTVTDIAGGDGYLDSGDVVAAGPALHRAMLAITRDRLARESSGSV